MSEDMIAKALKRAQDEFGVTFTEIDGPEPGYRLESPRHGNPVFHGPDRMKALGAALAGAKERGLINDG